MNRTQYLRRRNRRRAAIFGVIKVFFFASSSVIGIWCGFLVLEEINPAAAEQLRIEFMEALK